MKKIILSIIFIFPIVLSAKPFIEPFVGISKLEFKQTFSTGSETQRIANGFFLGARAGFVFLTKCFAGVEYYQGGPFNEVEGTDTKTTNQLYGAVLGVDFTDVRISASYYFSDVFDRDVGTSDINTNVKAARIGLGLPISNNRFRANFDVIFHFWGEEELGSGNSADVQTTSVSLSFPFGLLN